MKRYNRTRFACFSAYFTMSSIFCVPPLLFVTFRELYGISYTLLGTLILTNFCTQLLVDLIFTVFSKRFDCKKIVRVTPLVTSLGLALYALLPTLFPNQAYIGLLIGTIVILIYTFLGGFLAVCTTDFIQGMMMIIMILAVPIILLFLIEPGSIMSTLTASGVDGGAAAYLNPFMSGNSNISWTTVVSGLAWGLGYCGMPHILVRFMAIKSEKEMKKSKIIANIWNFLALGVVSVLAILARVYMFPKVGVLEDSENIVVMTVKELFTNQFAIPFLAGILLCAILAAIMSTADSQLLVTASAVSKDIYADVIKKGKNISDKKILWFSRVVVVIVAAAAFLIALNPNSSIMGLVSDAWAGLGAAFGPVVVLSLYWSGIEKEAVWASFAWGVGITVANMLLGNPVNPVDCGAVAMVGGFAVVPAVSFAARLFRRRG